MDQVGVAIVRFANLPANPLGVGLYVAADGELTGGHLELALRRRRSLFDRLRIAKGCQGQQNRRAASDIRGTTVIVHLIFSLDFAPRVSLIEPSGPLYVYAKLQRTPRVAGRGS